VGSVLAAHWPGACLYRPACDVYAVGPGGLISRAAAQIDSAADYVLLGSTIAGDLGLSLPFARQTGMSGAAGAQVATVSFPPEGLVSLFVTDYREYYYLPAPLVGFHPPSPLATQQRSVLGLTGFLQHFRFVLENEPTPPFFELHPTPAFPGLAGLLPLDRPLVDFIRSLRAGA
jgi:hypothetical protein